MPATKKAKRGRPTKKEQAQKREIAKWEYKESDMVKYLGLPKEALKEVRVRERQPIPRSEWKTEKGKTCMYTEGGFQVICKMFGLVPLDAKRHLAEQVEKEETYTYGMVTNMNFRNTSMVQADLCTDEGGKVMVKVGQTGNGNFIIGMPIPIRDINNGVGVLARANPRAKGRW